MLNKTVLVFALSLFFSHAALAQLTPFEDYDVSSELWNITLVQVNPNRGEDYLEGISKTWAAANAVAKELGHIEDYKIYQSVLPQSGDANLFLVVKFKDSSQLEPNKERYDAFMEAWGEDRVEQNREITQDYPSMRKIKGEYLVREITLK